MDYEQFKKEAEAQFLSFMPEKYQDMTLRVETVKKINRSLDGLTLVRNEAVKNVSPTIYINDMYETYLKTEDLQEVLQSAAQTMEKAFDAVSVVGNLDFDSAKDNIVFQVINTMQNEEMLKDMPHREFQDLSIIYRWIVKMDEQGIQSSVVRNNFANQLGMTEEQLFKCAVENTRRILPPTVKSMNDVMKEMFMADGMPVEIAEMMIDEVSADKMMWVISNDKRINGAGSMLYEDNLHKLAMKLETDLYILPSSIHECIAVSTDMGDPYELAAMVNEINMGEVDISERLSNNVYYYDREARKITLVTDTNIALDESCEDREFSNNLEALSRKGESIEKTKEI